MLGLMISNGCVALLNILHIHFFKLGFTPCKAEQLLQRMELKEKETKRLSHIGNLFMPQSMSGS